jgi:hypothetical protein
MKLVFYIGFMGSGKTTLGAPMHRRRRPVLWTWTRLFLTEPGSVQGRIGQEGRKSFPGNGKGCLA